MGGGSRHMRSIVQFVIYCTRILQERKTAKRMIEEGERKKEEKNQMQSGWVGGWVSG
jgi:hypothetical protein